MGTILRAGSLQNLSENKGKEIIEVIVCTFNTVYCSVSLVASVMFSIYANYPVMYSLSERAQQYTCKELC